MFCKYIVYNWNYGPDTKWNFVKGKFEINQMSMTHFLQMMQTPVNFSENILYSMSYYTGYTHRVWPRADN